MFSDTVGKGLPMWLPKGTALRIRLQDFLRRIQARYDYQEVMCPPIGNKNLYITSGHYAKYGKDSFQPIHTPEEGEEYFLKPMNCPHLYDLQELTPFLQRPAFTFGRVRYGLPLRAEWRVARFDTCT